MSTGSDAIDKPAPHPPRRGPSRRTIYTACALGLLAAVAVLPRVAAWPVFRDRLLARAVGAPHARATCTQLRLGWLSPVRLEGLRVVLANDPARPLVEVPSLTSEKPLWRLLFHGGDRGRVHLHQPQLTLVVHEHGTNLQEFLQGRQGPEQQQPHALRAELQISIHEGRIVVQGTAEGQPEARIEPVDLVIGLEPDGGPGVVTVQPATLLDRFNLSPVLCEAGLKYVAPVLADAAWVEGRASLELQNCRVPLDDPQTAEIQGRLTLHDVRTGTKNPLLRRIVELLAGLLRKPPPHGVRLADESVVEFQVADRQVAHDGLAFGLPEVSPELLIRSHGTVRLDNQQLEMLVAIPLPFHLLGDGPLAERLASQVIEVPVRGTLREPRLEVRGDGQPLSQLLSSLAGRVTGEESAADELADQLRDLGVELQQRLQERREDGPSLRRRIFGRRR
jgi:hypothetical protein